MSDERGERLRTALQNADRPRLWPNQKPRDAATLIVIDRRRDAPKVLMGRRHDGHKFMPGKFVFPGGRRERTDGSMPAASELAPDTAARLAARVTAPSRDLGRALALAAIRETYEETGLLIGSMQDGPTAAVPSPAWQAFAERGVLPELAGLSFIARAITPPRRPKRFDTRFFAVDREAICGETDGFVGPDKELVELVWVDLHEARALDLPRITAIILEELEHRLSGGLDGEGPVPFYREERGQFRRDLL